jgi:hypothetical protein
MKAYELINAPHKWVKRAWAMDAEGRGIDPVYSETEPVCYCVTGALLKAYSGNAKAQFDQVRLRIRPRLRALRLRTIEEWNDAPETTWEEVYRVLKDLDL